VNTVTSRVVAASVVKLRSSKLMFQAKGGGRESVQFAAQSFTKERFWPTATNRAILNRGRTWNWRSLLAPVMSLRSLR
jgi:hypothetical protein